ncbi:MAG: hypothetical protein KKG70_07080 [Proteobacteria bacterium]|nr:hypothetical protein [Pseudomonadota bacterium]
MPEAIMLNNDEKIRRKIILPFSVLILAILILCVYGGYHLQKHSLNVEIDSKLVGIKNLFDRFQAHEAKFMQSQLEFLAANEKLLAAWQNKDRTSLYQLSRPIFAEIKKKFGVTHFYFIGPDQVCFLRVHAPDNHGDTINRHTMRTAAATKDLAYGIELGPLGTFTLRVVYPWLINGEIIGYLELGEEIEHLTPQMRMVSGLDLIFTINKSNLDRKKWQYGVKMLGKKENWTDFENFVVIDKTIEDKNQQLKTFLLHSHNLTKNLTIGKRTYRFASLPLIDAGGDTVGELIALLDITKQIAQLKKMLLLSMASLLVVSGALFIFFYKYLGRIEKRLVAHQDHLENLVAARTKELQKALEEVKVLRGFLPICSFCKKIRDDQGYWSQMESYISKHSEAQFTHSICLECRDKHYPELNSSNK